MPSEGRVRFRPRARRDLIALHEYLISRASLAIADRYVARIEAACLALSSFPQRGSLQPHLGPDVRSIGFERRVTIVFRPIAPDVQILRILYGGRDIDQALNDNDG